MSERKGLFRFARLSMIAACMWNLDLPAFSKFTKLMYQTYSVVLPALVFLVPVLMIANFPSLLLTDPNSAIEVTPKMLYCAVLVIKTFSYQSSRCRYLLTAAMEEESRLYFINDDEVVRIYEEHIRYCRIFFKFFCISTMLPVSTECEIAIIKSYKFSQNLDAVGDKPMPLVSWYPFDKNRHHIWVMAHQFISIIVTGCYVLSVYVYYTSIMIYVRSRLLILQHYFRNYDQYQLDGESTTLETLKVLCAKHQDLINYINDVNRSVKMTVFLEYSVISILLATILYQLVEGQDMSFNLIFAFVVSAQLMFLAWTTDEITTESVNLATALYESKWYEQSQACKILIAIMMMGCRKPLSISIGPFGPMTMVSAMSRLKIAYSYMSVMTS